MDLGIEMYCSNRFCFCVTWLWAVRFFERLTFSYVMGYRNYLWNSFREETGLHGIGETSRCLTLWSMMVTSLNEYNNVLL